MNFHAQVVMKVVTNFLILKNLSVSGFPVEIIVCTLISVEFSNQILFVDMCFRSQIDAYVSDPLVSSTLVFNLTQLRVDKVN